MQPSSPKAIILFDGVCNLCSRTVQFIIRRDPKGYYQFASLQSDIAQKLLVLYNLDALNLDSIVLIEGGKAYTYSTAPLRIVKHLSGLWFLLYIFILVPRFIRDKLYKWVARHRYDWFGKHTTCMLPTPEQQRRFLS